MLNNVSVKLYVGIELKLNSSSGWTSIKAYEQIEVWLFRDIGRGQEKTIEVIHLVRKENLPKN